jgi:hypothetical protein
VTPAPDNGEARPGGAPPTHGASDAVRSEPEAAEGWRVRTVLVALDASRSSRAVAAAAAEMAAALHAELTGLFVEDAALARLADLPGGGWEVGSFAARPVAGADLGQRLRAQAERARRLFEAGAGRAAVAGSFRVVRGTVEREVAAAGGETVLLSLGRVGASAVSRLGSVARHALAFGKGPLLLLPPSGHLGPPVVAVYGGGEPGRHALAAAARLGRLRPPRHPARRRAAASRRRRGEPLVVLLPAADSAAAGRLREEAAALAAELGLAPRFRVVRLECEPPEAPGAAGHPADRLALTHAVAAERAAALVLPLGSPLATIADVETVVQALDCAVLLVR